MGIPHCEVKYVDEARAVFEERFAIGRFEDASWDIKHLRNSQHRRTNSRVYFTQYGSTIEPLPPRYANVVKACLLLADDVIASMPLRVDAFRMLWEALKLRVRPSLFAWSALQEVDLLEAEQQMLKHWGPSATQKRCTTLLRLVNSLSGTPFGPITRPLYVTFRTPRQEDFERYTIAGQEARHKKMPSDEALAAIGDMYHLMVTDDSDRLLLCVIGLLTATGLRVGEILTMPNDCEVREGGGYGLRYYKEKDDNDRVRVLWLKGSMIELAQLLIPEVRRLTANARERALILEQAPDTVVIPNHSPEDILSRDEVASLLGLEPDSLARISHSKLPRVPTSQGKDSSFKSGAVSDYLLSKRGPLWSIRINDAEYQYLSETLFIQFRNAGHATRGTNPLLVDSLDIGCVNDFLNGRTGQGERVVRSGFERYGLRDAKGDFYSLTSHQFRHWVTTIHAEADTPDHVLARWHGRNHIAEVASYKHLSQEKRLETLKEALIKGRIKGPLATMYFSLKSDVREAFLEGQLQAVHVTSLGLCVHNFHTGTCPYCLNCVKECADYLLDTANKDHLNNLVQLQVRTELTLDQAKKQMEKGEDDCSSQWVSDLEATLSGTKEILRAAGEGTAEIIQPFKKKKSKFVRNS